jgi:uncharacterized protein YjbI with pentapeptide repeats
MNENGFCPCGNFGVLGEDCPLCGKPFASDANAISPESTERSADDLGDHKETSIEEFVAKYNPRLRLAEALEVKRFFKNELSKLSLPEVAELLSLFSDEQLELLTVCEPGELAQLLAGGPEYPSWDDYAIFHARENGYEDRADIVELIGDDVESIRSRKTVEGLQSGGMKECRKCDGVKPMAAFADSSLISGYGRFCNDCKGITSDQGQGNKDIDEGSLAIAFGQLVSLISLVIFSFLVQFDGENCFESLTIVVWIWPLFFFVLGLVLAFCFLLQSKNQKQNSILGGWIPQPPKLIGVGDQPGFAGAVCRWMGRRLVGRPILRSLLLCHIGWATFIYVFFIVTSCLTSPAQLLPGWLGNSSETNLTGANLSGANLSGHYLAGADLSGADLTGANLTKANLTGANLSGANLTNADLTGTDLTRANLTGANLSGADLTYADLYGADPYEANLTDANLFRANLQYADLTTANLTGANLTGADLVGADLTGADLTGANLTNADLRMANLTNANLFRADLYGAKLYDVIGADFTGALNVPAKYR